METQSILASICEEAISKIKDNDCNKGLGKEVTTYLEAVLSQIEGGRAAKDEAFEQSWVAYRRKGSKAKSKQQWLKLNAQEREIVIKHIPQYIASVSDIKYQKDYERYLRDKVFLNVVYKNGIAIFDPERINDNQGEEYNPILDGFNMRWDNKLKVYVTNTHIDFLADGYTSENRPSCARVHQNGVTYRWDVKTKFWINEKFL